jgi:hypothetical protein
LIETRSNVNGRCIDDGEMAGEVQLLLGRGQVSHVAVMPVEAGLAPGTFIKQRNLFFFSRGGVGKKEWKEKAQ